MILTLYLKITAPPCSADALRLRRTGGAGIDFVMKYTQATLNKIEKLVAELAYVIRYERGTFQSGYCILEQRKVVVLNKFLTLEGRINALIELIPQFNVDPETLSPESKKVYQDIMSRVQQSGAEEPPATN